MVRIIQENLIFVAQIFKQRHLSFENKRHNLTILTFYIVKGEYVESELNYLEALKMETKVSYLFNLGVLYHR